MSINGISSGLNVINVNQQNVSRASARISSGSRINSAADDPAGQAISERLTRQISGFSQSIRNINDGVSLAQTADSALGGITEGLGRIRELSLQASNGILNAGDRSAINAEAQQIREEINRTVETSSFNGKSLFKDNASIAIQTGPEAGDKTDLATGNIAQLLKDSGFNTIDLSSADGAQQALVAADTVQTEVTHQRTELGAINNRLESSVNTLTTSGINAASARSRITDTDYASEVSNRIQSEIKEEVSIAMLAQANQQRKLVLNLL